MGIVFQPQHQREVNKMAADELVDKKQDEVIANLEKQIKTLEAIQIEFSEKRRGWVRMGMVAWFCALLTYVVIKYTGGEAGQIKPEIIWSFGTGVLVTKLLDHYINAGTANDRG
jgi:hypothetical protein